MGEHQQAKGCHEDTACLEHAPVELRAEQSADGAEAEQQGNRAEAEDEHGKSARIPAAGAEGVDLHGLERTAGHEPIEQTDDKGTTPRGRRADRALPHPGEADTRAGKARE